MMKHGIKCDVGPALAILLLGLAVPVSAKEYTVPAGIDVGKWFAGLPKDATAVVFSEAAQYQSEGDIVLPERELLVIDGKGSRLILGKNSNGFTSPVTGQKQAMVHANYRYLIKDFASIKGGRKAIDLQASLGSIVQNCHLDAQTEAAVDLRFCLLARLSNLRITNPRDKGVVVRHGDWKGANGFNSQSNNTVLEQVRVYCMTSTTAAFTILNTNGVRMTDCVSEGTGCDYDIFLSARLDGTEDWLANNTVVKSFTLSNFHVEHEVRKASIYVNMPIKATVNLENVYWNSPQKAPVILYTMGQLNLYNIGWWNSSFWIGTRVNAPRINIFNAPSELELKDKVVRDNRAGFLRMVDPLPRNGTLQLNYVFVRWKAI
ncbi:MAG: hypothetical protein J5I62_03360 [Flavobacteriales bacterium]|nr:hypothetical protein [Flavobacteriales bacterium]